MSSAIGQHTSIPRGTNLEGGEEGNDEGERPRRDGADDEHEDGAHAALQEGIEISLSYSQTQAGATIRTDN